MRRRHSPRLVFAALAAVFFATPLALIVAGVGARAFENRRLAPAPKVADGWKFFDDATRYLIDRMPLRYQAVHANTWIDRHIFAMTPQYGLNGLGGVANDQALPFAGRPQQDKAAIGATAPKRGLGGTAQPPPTADQVAVGLDGWYYLQGVFNRACTPFMPFHAAAHRWEQLLDVIRASGRRVELLIPPDKSTIYPEFVRPSRAYDACNRAGTAALWRQIESPAAQAAGIIGLRKPLLSEKLTTSVPLYYRTDSHWNNVGALAMVRSALPRLSPTVRVLPSEIVDTGPKPYSGDLLGLLGQSGSETAPTRGIVRTPEAPRVPGNTVIIGDSYAETALSEMKPYFDSLTLLNWTENTQKQILDALDRSQNVILETVEREFDFRALDAAYVNPKTIAIVRASLAKHPLGGQR